MQTNVIFRQSVYDRDVLQNFADLNERPQSSNSTLRGSKAMRNIFQPMLSTPANQTPNPHNIGKRKLSSLNLRLSMELRRLLEFDRDRLCSFLGFLGTGSFSGHSPNSFTSGPLSTVPAGSISNPSLILRDRVFVIDTESVGDVGAVALELIEEVGVCIDTLELSLPLDDEGIFASTLAWVLSVHADGGILVAGKDSTRARKGTGCGPSILCALRDSCLPRFMLAAAGGHDIARAEEPSLSSLSEAEGLRGVVKTKSVCRRCLGSNCPLSAA